MLCRIISQEYFQLPLLEITNCFTGIFLDIRVGMAHMTTKCSSCAVSPLVVIKTSMINCAGDTVACKVSVQIKCPLTQMPVAYVNSECK